MDTPRTDALREELDPGWPLMSFEEAYDLMTDFSCALERELAAEKARGDRLEKALIAAKKALESMPRSYGFYYGPLPQIYDALGDSK